MKSYGITNQKAIENEVDLHVENLKVKGFSVQQHFLSDDLCDYYCEKAEKIYSLQENVFGKEALSKINELDLVRMPFMQDESFFKLFMNPFILELGEKIIGKHFQLHLQNGIINRPKKEHHQTSWHRDLPYQDWVISKPLAFNAFYCLTDFTSENGATFVLPYSHRLDYFPSTQFITENEIQLIAPKGSIVFFDSMIYHRAGLNTSSDTRIGINNLFVVPILKQQIDLTDFAEASKADDDVKAMLGTTFKLEKDVTAYRNNKLRKLNG